MINVTITAERLNVLTNGDGVPLRLVRRETVHPVKEVVKHWRIDREWWRSQIRFDYYKIVTTTGLLLVIYQNLLTGKWYLVRKCD